MASSILTLCKSIEKGFFCFVDMDFGFVTGDPVSFDKLSRWDS